MKKAALRIREITEKLKTSPRRKTTYVLCYTALFALCALLAFCHFLLRGKGFVWCGDSGNIDGISQHYVALSYWGSYLRDIVRTLFTEGRLSIPLYDTSIGMGSDVLMTLSYYVAGDPLNLLSALVPRAATEYLYYALILVRLYLAGLSFSAFALYLKKNNRLFTLIASIVYLFSGYTLFAAVRHPYFTNPMIYLPLILLGAEMIFRGQKPWLFIGAVALAGLSNFYFFYMICLFTLLYVLVRMWDYCPKGERKRIWSYLWRFALYALIGILMAGALFYPSIRTTLASSRQAAGGSMPILYGIKHYVSYIYAMSAGIGLGEWDFHGLLPLSLMAIFLLWTTPRARLKAPKRLFLLCTLFLLVPFFGWVINGTAYVSNRWVWAYDLLIACLCAFLLPEVDRMSKKAWCVLLGGAALYAYFSIYLEMTSVYYQVGILGVLITVILAAGIRFLCADAARRQKAYRLLFLVLAVVQVTDMAYARYENGGYADSFMPLGQCYNANLEAQGAPLTNLGDTSYYRYEDCFEDQSSRQRNATLINGGHSTNTYFSLASDTWYDLVRSLGHRDVRVQTQEGLDNRAVLGTLANVKYFTVRSGKEAAFLPYGYGPDPLFTATIKNSALYSGKASGHWAATNTFAYYQNQHALPFGYTYDSYITKEEYDGLSYVDRQRALLQSAVLEEPSETLTKGRLPETTAPVTYELTHDSTIRRNGNVFQTESGGKITLTLQNARPDCETYLNIGHVEFYHQSPLELALAGGYWNTLNLREKKHYLEKTVDFTRGNTVTLTAAMEQTAKEFTYETPNGTYYAGVHDYSIHMGHYQQAPTTITITLAAKGEYTLEDITVTQLGFDGFAQAVDKLGAEHLTNVVFEDNRVSGEITVSTPKLLCLSLPYSAGWTAYVDGEETEIVKTDLAFMGVELAPGEHTVELRYFTPYLAPGLAMSGLGWSIFIIWLIVDLRKRKQKEGSK